MLPPDSADPHWRSLDNRLRRSLAWHSQTEVGKELGGKLPEIEKDALDRTGLLGKWTQESNVATDEPPHSEPSVSSLDVQ
jgi:hypothetical protein